MGELQRLGDRPKRAGEQKRGLQGRGSAGPGQEAGQAGRAPGSGDRAGVSSGAGGLRFLLSAWRVWGYQPAQLPSQRH